MIDSLLIAFWSPGPTEMMVLAVVALLLYGGNLPEVARSWGKTFAEFRRGLSGFQNELNEVIYREPEQIAYRDDTLIDQGYEDPDDDDPSFDDVSYDDPSHNDVSNHDAGDGDAGDGDAGDGDQHFEANRNDFANDQSRTNESRTNEV